MTGWKATHRLPLRNLSSSILWTPQNIVGPAWKYAGLCAATYLCFLHAEENVR